MPSRALLAPIHSRVDRADRYRPVPRPVSPASMASAAPWVSRRWWARIRRHRARSCTSSASMSCSCCSVAIAVSVVGHVQHPVGLAHGPELLRLGEVHRVRRQQEDRPVQRPVEPVDRGDVPFVRGHGDLTVDGAQSRHLVLGRPADRPEQFRLQEFEQVVDLLDLVGTEPRDEVTLVRPMRQQTLRGEHPQRLPQRHPADPQHACHLLLAHLLSRSATRAPYQRHTGTTGPRGFTTDRRWQRWSHLHEGAGRSRPRRVPARRTRSGRRRRSPPEHTRPRRRRRPPDHRDRH
jgi:hypothetical protein